MKRTLVLMSALIVSAAFATILLIAPALAEELGVQSGACVQSEYERQMEIGRRATESGELSKALAVFQEMSLRHNGDSKVMLSLARVYYHLSKRDKAVLSEKEAALEYAEQSDKQKLEQEIADLRKSVAINEKSKSEIMTRFRKTLPKSHPYWEFAPLENEKQELNIPSNAS